MKIERINQLIIHRSLGDTFVIISLRSTSTHISLGNFIACSDFKIHNVYFYVPVNLGGRVCKEAN